MSRSQERTGIQIEQRVTLLEYDADHGESVHQEMKNSVEKLHSDIVNQMNAIKDSFNRWLVGLLGSIVVALIVQLILVAIRK